MGFVAGINVLVFIAYYFHEYKNFTRKKEKLSYGMIGFTMISIILSLAYLVYLRSGSITLFYVIGLGLTFAGFGISFITGIILKVAFRYSKEFSMLVFVEFSSVLSMVILVSMLTIYEFPAFDYNIFIVLLFVEITLSLYFLESVYRHIHQYGIKYHVRKLNDEMQPVMTQIRRSQHDYANLITSIQYSATNRIHFGDRIEVVGELESYDTLFKLCPLIRSALSLKLEQCHSAEIDGKLKIDLQGLLPRDLLIKEHEVVAILTNLIDNSIEALINVETQTTKKISIVFEMIENYIYIKVGNSHDTIHEDLLDLWFKEGYTTKEGTRKRGFGLLNVSEVVNKYNGNIECVKEEDITFLVTKFKREELVKEHANDHIYDRAQI